MTDTLFPYTTLYRPRPSLAPGGPAPKIATRWFNSPLRLRPRESTVTMVRVTTTQARPHTNHRPAQSREKSSDIFRTKPKVAIRRAVVSHDRNVLRQASDNENCAEGS